MMWGFVLLGLSITVTLTSYFGVGVLTAWARERNILDVPNERASHTRPTPRGGGLVIVLTAVISWLVYLLIVGAGRSGVQILAYLVGAGAVAFISWRDDLQSIPYWLRFAVHSGAALLALAFIGYWHDIKLPVAGSFEIGWLGLPLTFLWVVGLTNAYNFMDGIDGLAGGQAVIAALSWAVVGWQYQQLFIVALSIFLAASSLGFLSHNWPPARIFMGDVGSAFLGYTFAVLPLLMAPVQNGLPVAAMLFFWLFVFDTGFTLLRRLRSGEKVFTAHRSHLYQRLVIAGYSHRPVTVLYLSLALLNAVLGLWWVALDAGHGLIVLILALESIGLWRLVVLEERKRSSPPGRPKKSTPPDLPA